MDALTPAEIATTVKLLRAAGHVDDNTRYPAITLLEADKQTIRKWKSGDAFTRSAFAVFYANGRAERCGGHGIGSRE